MLEAWSDAPDVFPTDLRAAYIAQFRDPDRVHAICEEYRAAATLDYEHDEAHRMPDPRPLEPQRRRRRLVPAARRMEGLGR
jgi:hypothetical protein